MGKRPRKTEHLLVEYYLGGKRTPPLLKEEFWRNRDGVVTRYSLAYIDPAVCQTDHGRVLGYDNAHGWHHRHFMGKESAYDFVSFEEVLRRFEREVRQLRRKHGT